MVATSALPRATLPVVVVAYFVAYEVILGPGTDTEFLRSFALIVVKFRHDGQKWHQ